MLENKNISVSLEIETIVKKTNCGYLEAVVTYSTENDIEQEVMSQLISPDIIEKIRIEAEKLNLIKKSLKTRELF